MIKNYKTFNNYHQNGSGEVYFQPIFRCFALCILLVFSINLYGQVNPKISVQGTFKDANNVAVDDGVQTVTFRLYHAATGGTAVWEEEAEVTVKGGLYSHNLGSVVSFSDLSIFGEAVYLGISVNGYELQPRGELTHTPYALFTEFANTSNNGVPTGTILPFAGTAGSVPTGYLLCDGSSYSQTDYANLFSVINTTYGSSSGSTFNVPDLRGEFIRGLDNGRGVDDGRTLGSAQSGATALPTSPFNSEGTTTLDGEHGHTIQTMEVASYAITPGGPIPVWSPGVGQISTEGVADHQHDVTSTVKTGGDSETRPRNVSVNFIIKY